MINCSSCGKPMDKIPVWLSSANVEFVCNNCPNRHTKNIAFVNLGTELPPTAKEAAADVEEAPDDEAEDEA